jgi:hypothetical protein
VLILCCLVAFRCDPGCWCAGFERTSLWALISGKPTFQPIIATHDYFHNHGNNPGMETHWLATAPDSVCEQLCAALGINPKSGRLGQVIQLVILASFDGQPLWTAVEALHVRRGKLGNFFTRRLYNIEYEEEEMYSDESDEEGAGESASDGKSDGDSAVHADSAAHAFPHVNGAHPFCDELKPNKPKLLERLEALALQGRLGSSPRLIDDCMQLNRVLREHGDK